MLEMVKHCQNMKFSLNVDQIHEIENKIQVNKKKIFYKIAHIFSNIEKKLNLYQIFKLQTKLKKKESNKSRNEQKHLHSKAITRAWEWLLFLSYLFFFMAKPKLGGDFQS